MMSNQLIPVRYGLMAVTEQFLAEPGAYRIGDEVIVRTARGVDVGVVAGGGRAAGADEKGQGELVRGVNDADRSILKHIREAKEPEEFTTCQQCVKERNLPMRLVGVEHLFSGDKIIFYFLAENRVDFRELVKDLARRYRTRIEMRQIGVRDEARLLADYEHCGRELCCRTFIRNLEPVTMRMAKIQKTTLDPSKISGHCGRLMCCLRFEDEVYSYLQAEMPPRGATCVTESCTGEVVAAEMLKQEVTLALPDGTQQVVKVSDIKEVKGGGRGTGRQSGQFSSRRSGQDSGRACRNGGGGGGSCRRCPGANSAPEKAADEAAGADGAARPSS